VYKNKGRAIIADEMVTCIHAFLQSKHIITTIFVTFVKKSYCYFMMAGTWKDHSGDCVRLHVPRELACPRCCPLLGPAPLEGTV
jgi:hypothetical protein